MGQYTAAKLIFESENGHTVKQLMDHTGNVESTVRTTLHKLESKDIIVEEGGIYKPHPDATKADLERVRSYTIEELGDES